MIAAAVLVSAPVSADGGAPLSADLLGANEVSFGDPDGTIDLLFAPAAEGRMDGGGTFWDASGVRYHHGFNVRCDGQRPHNLQIRGGDGTRFHMEELIGVLCFKDPGLAAGSPHGGLNTILGNGLGRLSDACGTPVWFHLTDEGEPGTGVDFARFFLDGAPVVSGVVESGNHRTLKQSP